MKYKILLPLIIASGLVLFTGCGTATHVVTAADKPVNSHKITFEDYKRAAAEAAKKLGGSGALDKVPNPPALVFISQILNNTDQQIDEELPLLTTKISIALGNKIKVTSTDPKTIGMAEKNAFLTGTGSPYPDFTLSGNIIQHVDRDGDTRRTTYSFQLSLNDPKTGYQIWQGETEIGKQSTRAKIGL